MADVEVISLAGKKTEASSKVLCTVFVQPFTNWHDAWTPKVPALVNINGKRAWSTAPITDIAKLRGVHTLVLDPYTGTLSNIQQWDTNTNPASAENLAAYINGLQDGTILIGVTYHDPIPNIGPAHDSLTQAGVFINDLNNGGNFAFIMQKGYPDKTQFVKGRSCGEINWLNVSVTGGDTPDSINLTTGPTLSCDVFLQPSSYNTASSIPDLQSFVDVNKQRVHTSAFGSGFPSRHGVTLMILDPCTGTVSNITQFNTQGDGGAADRLNNTLTYIPNGYIVIAVTWYDANNCMNQGCRNQISTILGLNINDVGTYGNWAIIAQRGFPQNTLSVKGLNYLESNYVDVSISGSSCDSLKFEYGNNAVSNVRIETASWSSDKKAKSTVWVDKRRVWVSTGAQSRGVTLMFLNPSSDNVYTINTYDTGTIQAQSTELANEINRMPKGPVVIGVSYEDPMTNLNDAAVQALASIGVNVAGIPQRGRFAFVAQKGYKERTQMVRGEDTYGTSVLSVCVSGTTSPSVTITRQA